MKRLPLFAALALLVLPAPASAFCGFYVGGAGGELYNKATMVVLMRDGTRTVLSMQNAYEGPPEDFAMVVPVPSVLQQEDVHTLSAELFDRVDRLAAPRLVEYWERDPCTPPPPPMAMVRTAGAEPMDMDEESSGDGLGVRVEAEFAVGEYDIVILSAGDSSGLETWLHREGYRIPDGAGQTLRPYVEQGTKFFVARVDIERVPRDAEARAMLSPLRVQYESDQLTLPVRLGLINSDSAQDLIVHVLARGQRFEVANYPNVTVPTNLRVNDRVRENFGAFYASLFDHTVSQHPNSVVTEYAWDASSCDPCPGPVLSPEDIATLGQDAIGGSPAGWTLSRLHYRYTADALGDDLVFRAADGIVGGRGTPDAEGVMSREIQHGGSNFFQGRYAILHPWEGAVTCASPQHGVWGGPPEGRAEGPAAVQNVAFAPRDQPLGVFLDEDVPEISAVAADPSPAIGQPGSGQRIQGGGCASCAVGSGQPSALGLVVAGLLGLVMAWRRRR